MRKLECAARDRKITPNECTQNETVQDLINTIPWSIVTLDTNVTSHANLGALRNAHALKIKIGLGKV